MKKVFVVLGTLLNQKPELVEAAFANTDESVAEGMLNNFVTGNKIFTISDYETHNKNLLNDFEKGLIEKAKTGKLSPELYGVIKGSVTEMNEKEIAKEFGVTSYTNLADLLSQAKAKSGDKDAVKLQKELDAVKLSAKEWEEKYNKLDTTYAEKHSKTLIESQRESAFKKIELDYPVESMPKQSKLFMSAFNNEHEIKIEDGKTVVYKDGKPIRNAALEPIPVSDVMNTFATEYGFKLKSPETGGRGQRTAEPTTLKYKGKTDDEFTAILKKDNIQLGTAAADEEFKLFKEQNK